MTTHDTGLAHSSATLSSQPQHSAIRLRALEPTDLQLVYDIENDVSLWPCGTQTVPFSHEVVAQYIASTRWDLYADRQARLVVELQGAVPVAIGLADLCNFEPRHQRAEVAIVMQTPWQRRGYALSALQLLERMAVHDGVVMLYAVTSTANMAAERLFAAAGYTRTSLLPSWLAMAGGQRQDATLWTKCIAGERG